MMKKIVDELMYVGKAWWQILWSVPVALAFVILYGLLLTGFGLKVADRLIVAWQSVVVKDPDFMGGPS